MCQLNWRVTDDSRGTSVAVLPPLGTPTFWGTLQFRNRSSVLKLGGCVEILSSSTVFLHSSISFFCYCKGGGVVLTTLIRYSKILSALLVVITFKMFMNFSFVHNLVFPAKILKTRQTPQNANWQIKCGWLVFLFLQQVHQLLNSKQ